MKATLQDIATRLGTLNLPVAYDHFITAKEPPLLCYRITSQQIAGADDKNLYKNSVCTIELYTNTKDIVNEQSIETLFNDVELSVYMDYISEENLFLTEYTFEFTTIL